MTAPEREQQILSMLDALSQCKPRDMDELTLWTNEDAVTGQGISLPAPIFKDQL